MTYDVVVVEDEPAIQELLRQVLTEAAPDLRILAICSTVKDAVVAIRDLRPQLLLLDVMIEGGTSFDIIAQLPAGVKHEVIFITAHDRYAVEAFRHAAVGYVLKPIDRNDLKAALDEARRRLAVGASVESLRQVLAHLGKPATRTGERLAIPTAQGFLFRPTAELLHCESNRNYTWLHFRDGERILSSYNLGEFRRVLPTDGFVQIHKSHLVALHAIQHYASREGEVTLSDGTRLPVSRAAKNSFLKQFLLPNRGDSSVTGANDVS